MRSKVAIKPVSISELLRSKPWTAGTVKPCGPGAEALCSSTLASRSGASILAVIWRRSGPPYARIMLCAIGGVELVVIYEIE